MNTSKMAADPRGHHIRIYCSMFDSMAWTALDYSAVCLYLSMRRSLLRTNNGNISATLETLRHRGFCSSATLAKGLRSLQAVGLIAQTRQGGIARGSRFCSLYRFTDEITYEHPKHGVVATPATNEWKSFTTLATARKAIDEAHKNAKRPQKKKIGLHILKQKPSTYESSPLPQPSEIESANALLAQRLKTCCEEKRFASPLVASLSPVLATKRDSVRPGLKTELLCMLPPTMPLDRDRRSDRGAPPSTKSKRARQ